MYLAQEKIARYKASPVFFKKIMTLSTLLCACLLLAQCMLASLPDKALREKGLSTASVGTETLTPAEQYAGEILSYLLPLVLGREGRMERRDAWQQRALGKQLDFDRIVAKMEGSNNGKSDLLVLDSNILGLSAVLYHYSRDLNQFKGRYLYDSLYPSSELVAIRLLLLQMIHRQERARLGALAERQALLMDPQMAPTPSDVDATGMNPQELRLLGDVLQSEPVFAAYLVHPFLVDSFYRLGVVRKDAFVAQKIAAANYAPYPACSRAMAPSKGRVVITLLPSLTKEFDYENGVADAAFPFGFKPTPTYRAVTDNLQHAILEQTATLTGQNLGLSGNSQTAKSADALRSALRARVAERVAFCVQDKRPLVIYPGNADRVLQGSAADLNIILLGKDVYLALEIRPDKDIYPHTNRIYLDLMDVKHNQVDEEINQISAFIFSKLKADLFVFEDGA